jgi:photosystem II stability/assembly factor-like uncharacterized protein
MLSVRRTAALSFPAAMFLLASLNAQEFPGHHTPRLTAQQSGTTNRLQAVSPVNSEVVWVSGVGGTFALTTDGGAHWKPGVVAGAETLEFRDVQGISEKVAYLLSAGTGTDARIYKTEDGGESWSLQFENRDLNAFYDCFAFWTPKRGLAMSDSVDGVFPVIETTDGVSWQDIGNRLPTAQAGEAAFAASGTCVATQGKRRAWIGTGGAEKARILATTDAGETWNAYDTPIVQGTASSGIFSVDFRDGTHGILGGGELAAPTIIAETLARSSDGGKNWTLVSEAPFPGAIYGLSYVRELHGEDRGDDEDRPGSRGRLDSPFARSVVITGPAGAAWSPDEGDTWHSLPEIDNFWAVAFASPKAGWLVGTSGRIVKITF